MVYKVGKTMEKKPFHLQHTVSAPVRVAFMCFFLKNEKYERMVKMVS